MSSPKKVLFVSCAAGAGHVRAAEALLSELQTKHPEIITDHLDLVDFSHPALCFILSTAYISSVRHYPLLYKLIYELSNNKTSNILLNILAFFLCVITKKYRQKIRDFNPDIIISTYFFSTALLPPTSAKIYTVITDYKHHQVWFNKKSVGYFVATEEIKKEIESQSDAKVVVSGIPINPEFLKEKNTEKIKNDFGLNNQLPTILILPCQSGTIAPDKIVKQILNKPYNIIAVAGKSNPNIYKNFLELKKEAQNFWPLPYSDKIDELMRMSDVIITKAGGITITECLHLGKPIIVVNPIPGQEEHNTEMILKNNYGVKIEDLAQLETEITKILGDKNYLKKAKLPDNPNAVIIDFCLSF